MIKRAVSFASISLALGSFGMAAFATDMAPPGVAREVAAAAVEPFPTTGSQTPPTSPAQPDKPTMLVPEFTIAVPPNTLYFCVMEVDGVRRQNPIQFTPKVEELCAKHPEMSPCQYERNVCRGSGGRVYAASGQEITMAMEAEYDRKVLRVQLR
jgi:hypothetical protein